MLSLFPRYLTNTNWDTGIPVLYMCGSGCMALMVAMVFLYVQRFGTSAEAATASKGPKKKADMLEGLKLFWK